MNSNALLRWLVINWPSTGVIHSPMTDSKPMDGKPMNGACHCGTVRFTVKLAEGLEKPRRCNCSFCRMRGAVVATALLGDIEVTSGADTLTL